MKRITDEINTYVHMMSVGKYEIRLLSNGKFWIEHESGEGFMISEKELAKEIEEMFKRLM